MSFLVATDGAAMAVATTSSRRTLCLALAISGQDSQTRERLLAYYYLRGSVWEVMFSEFLECGGAGMQVQLRSQAENGFI